MANDWITHDGGPCQVAPETLIAGIRTRVVQTAFGLGAWEEAGTINWKPVIAYRLAAPAAETCERGHDWDYLLPGCPCHVCGVLKHAPGTEPPPPPARLARDMPDFDAAVLRLYPVLRDRYPELYPHTIRRMAIDEMKDVLAALKEADRDD